MEIKNKTKILVLTSGLILAVALSIFFTWRMFVNGEKNCDQALADYYNNTLKGKFDDSCKNDTDCIVLVHMCVRNTKENIAIAVFGENLHKRCAKYYDFNEFIRKISGKSNPPGGTELPISCSCENNNCNIKHIVTIDDTNCGNLPMSNPLESCDGRKVKITGTILGSKGYYLCNIVERKVKFGWFDENCILLDAPSINVDLDQFIGRKVSVIGTVRASDGNKCGGTIQEQCAGLYHATEIKADVISNFIQD